MNYIILDMEWDSAYSKKHSRFINQILQIGAVKLDCDFNIIDTLDIMIKSSYSKKVSSRFTLLTGITTEMMLSGISLEAAFKKYNGWIGDDTVTLTWSNSDLYTILENEELLLKDVHFKIDKYLDLQRFIQNEMKLSGIELNSQISLEHAANALGITTEGFELHTAKDDSLLCAALLKKCYNRERFEPLIKDTANPEFYKRLRFKTTYIDDLKSPDIDRAQLRFKCIECGGKTKRLSKWKYRNRWFCASFKCTECGKQYNGRVSFKKTYDEVVVKRKLYIPKPKSTEVKDNDMQAVSEKMLG